MDRIDPIDVEFLINSNQVKKDAKSVRDDLGKIAQDAEGVTAKVRQQTSGIAQNYDKLGASLNKTTVGVKSNFNGLNNSINQLTREIPAFTYSAQTGFLAISNNIPILADEINRLRANNDALVASGQKGIPIWKQLVKGLFSWQTLLSVGVSLLTIYAREIADFIGQLFKSKEAIDANVKAQEALNKAYDSANYKKAVKNVLELKANIDLAKKGILEKTDVIDQYNKILGDAAGEVNTLAEAEQGVIDKAPAYVKAMLFKAAAAQSSADAAKLLVENAKRQQEIEDEITALNNRDTSDAVTGFNPTAPGSLRASSLKRDSQINEAQERRNELLKEQKELLTTSDKVYKSLITQAQEAAKTAGLDIFGGGDNGDTSKSVSARKRLLEQIADLDREYARKQLDDNQAELDALREKFDKIRQLVTDFNKDPKNSKVQIDVERLNPIQERAEADLLFRQDTEALKRELTEQKRVFKEYETFKREFGKAEADKRYQEQLKEFDTYADLLKDRIKENQDAFKAVDTGDANAAQIERVELLKESQKEEQEALQAHFREMLTKYRDFETQRIILTEQYQDDYKRLQEAGKFREARELTRQFKEELDQIGEAQIKSTEGYQRLLLGVENLSRNAAETVITEARRMVDALLQAGKISELQAAKIIAKLDEAQKKLDKQNAEDSTSGKLNNIAADLDLLSSAFLELGASLESYDQGLADTITTVGELTGVLSDAAAAGASFASGDIIGGIANTIKAVAGVFRIGAKARESERQAEQKLLELQYEREDGERRLNKLQRDRNLAKAQEIELTIEGLKAQRAALLLSKEQAKADEQSLLRELQGLEYISGSATEKFGGFLGIGRKTRVVNTYASLLGKTFEEIEEFYERGLLEGRAEKLFEQLRALRQEGEDIDGLLRQLEDDTRQVLTGTTENAIADSIINGLKQGYDSFEDFAGDIERLLQDAILNSIKYNVLEEPIKQLYEEFAKFAESEGELTQAEADAIRQRYEQQVQTAIDQYNALSDVLDFGTLDAENQRQGLTGAIRREMTEETASELVGLFRSYHDISRKMLEANISHYEKEQQYQQTMLGLIALNTAIEVNTRNTALHLERALISLAEISENTEKIYMQDLG